VVRSDGGEGLQAAELAERMDADLVLIGSRGLGGARAVLGSVSDMVAALAAGPVLVGFDGSAGAQAALATAARLFPT
jgi:nucleotide-binding universal stress UspA family protein